MIRPEITKGTPVRVTRWTVPQPTGVVRRREGDVVYVAYHGSFVEDELYVADVEALREELLP